MAIRDKIASKAQQHLQPGEQIQGVLFAQTASQYLILIGWIPFLIMNKYRTIIATDRRILVFHSGVMTTTNSKDLVAELPRTFRLGPWTGNVWHRHQIGNENLRIHRRFKKDIEEIDGVSGQAQAPGFPPPPPAPRA